MPRLQKVVLVAALLVLAVGGSLIAAHFYQRNQRWKLAVQVVNDTRNLNQTIEEWAFREGKLPGAQVSWGEISDILPPHNPLVRNQGRDALGREYAFSNVRNGVKINEGTFQELSDAVPADFWGRFEPSAPENDRDPSDVTRPDFWDTDIPDNPTKER